MPGFAAGERLGSARPSRVRLHVIDDGADYGCVDTAKPAPGKIKPSRDKVRAHRERLRRLGLRPIQIWVPDVRSPSFKGKAHGQSLAVAKSPHAKDDQGFIDAAADWRAE